MDSDEQNNHLGRKSGTLWKNILIPEKHIRTTLLTVDRIALKYGWVSDWGEFSPAELDDLLKEWSEVTNCELLISGYFIEYYSDKNFQRIEYLINDWDQNPIFKERILIFRDCLFALQNQKPPFNPSNLVVPILISQIDGIIKEILVREGWVFNKKDKRWAHPDTIVKANSENSFGSIIKEKRNCLGDYYIGKLSQTNSRYDILIKGLFQKSYYHDELNNPFFLSRHKILHGEDIDYGTLKNTIQLFLILNYLYNFNISRLTEPDDSDVVEFRKLVD